MYYIGILFAFGNMIFSSIANVIYKSQNKKIKAGLMLIIQTIVSAIAFIIITAAMGDFYEIFKIGLVPFLAFVFAAIFGIVLGNFIFFISLELIDISKAYPIALTYPLLTYIFEIIFLHGSFRWLKLLGIVLVVIGIILIGLSKTNSNNESKIIHSVNEKKEEDINNFKSAETIVKEEIKPFEEIPTEKKETIKKSKFNLLVNNKTIFGIILALITAITWASGTTLIKFGLNLTDIEVIPINGARMIFLVPLSLFYLIIPSQRLKKNILTWKSVTLVAIGSLLGLVVANIFYILAIDEISTSTPAAIAASGPIISTPLSILFLKEKAGWKIILGTIFTICGNVLVILLK